MNIIGDIITIIIPCGGFCGLLAIGGAICELIEIKEQKEYDRWFRHRHDKIKLAQTAEMAAIAQPYLKENM